MVDRSGIEPLTFPMLRIGTLLSAMWSFDQSKNIFPAFHFLNFGLTPHRFRSGLKFFSIDKIPRNS
jgi:hypothetical protein